MEFLHKLAKAAEDMARQLTPMTDHQENEENFHPEKKNYFSAPKI